MGYLMVDFKIAFDNVLGPLFFSNLFTLRLIEPGKTENINPIREIMGIC
jgi:hypothetical protein